ncbi:hypothetical protein LWF01_18285 [Saxibacter everestensis]|uniref:Lipoprotein LpqN n=1 Tax=Saxibacter everestensis TaxID=2909229 RepID=A0ABY8QSL9_9MICO|nr:hypothetical protein LWF01_18285 [Brevibacteriaceae bacterium ZFBP1038]
MSRAAATRTLGVASAAFGAVLVLSACGLSVEVSKTENPDPLSISFGDGAAEPTAKPTAAPIPNATSISAPHSAGSPAVTFDAPREWADSFDKSSYSDTSYVSYFAPEIGEFSTTPVISVRQAEDEYALDAAAAIQNHRQSTHGLEGFDLISEGELPTRNGIAIYRMNASYQSLAEPIWFSSLFAVIDAGDTLQTIEIEVRAHAGDTENRKLLEAMVGSAAVNGTNLAE